VLAALIEGVRAQGLDLLPWPDGASALRARVAFAVGHGADLPDLSDNSLLASLDEWLPPLIEGKRRLGDVAPQALHAALEARLGWEGTHGLTRLAPPEFASPAGSHHAIDYAAEGGPAVELRVQALFGLTRHPTVAGGDVPLVLRLTSPAGRPIQTTRDLPGFWRGSWAAVAREMRGRYPKHPWPDDPATADPTLRTKKATSRA
jgi:ATP-dependent helicase HrpB